MSDPMKLLPQELIVKIFDYLDMGDIERARLN